MAAREMKVKIFMLAAVALSLSFCSSCATLERVVTPENVGRAFVIVDEGRRILRSVPEPEIVPEK